MVLLPASVSAQAYPTNCRQEYYEVNCGWITMAGDCQGECQFWQCDDSGYREVCDWVEYWVTEREEVNARDTGWEYTLGINENINVFETNYSERLVRADWVLVVNGVPVDSCILSEGCAGTAVQQQSEDRIFGFTTDRDRIWIAGYGRSQSVGQEEWVEEEGGDEGWWGWWSPPPPPPPTVNLNGPPIVEIPDPITLSWNSSNADSCSASGEWSGGKSTSGSETIKGTTSFADRGNHSYSLSCSGPGGTASDDAVVQVVQVPRCVFIAEPENIILPQFSTLSWECQYCDTAYINQGIGDVNCSGTQNVRPDKTTTYTLTAYGLDGNRMFQAIVGVGFIPVWKEILPR